MAVKNEIKKRLINILILLIHGFLIISLV